MTTWTRIAALTCAVLSGASRADDKPVAVVDGVSISREDFLRVYRSTVERFMAEGLSPQALDLLGLHQRVLDSLIDAEVLHAAMNKSGATVTDAELKERLAALKKDWGADGGSYEEAVIKENGSVARFEANVRTGVFLERVVGEPVTDQEVHDRCRKLTELASLAMVEFDERAFRSDVKPPPHKLLVAWAATHQAEIDARFADDARPDGYLFAIRRRGAWVTGDETEIREMLALELYIVSQAKVLARREAEKTLAAVKKGKRLDALFPDDVIHTEPFSPLDTTASRLTMTPELADAIFRLKKPGPLGSVLSEGERLVVATVETRQVLREAVCRSKAETWRRELRDEKDTAARSAFIKALREKAVITIDESEVAQLTDETLDSLSIAQ